PPPPPHPTHPPPPLGARAGPAPRPPPAAADRATVNDLLDCIPLLVRNLEHSQQQHTALVEAVLERDAEGARAVMREHCCGTAALLRGFLA
ncbi:FCD domain-containing protein, partial [Streptomyces sp. NPDC048551]|uniref:FCD domain-containing protein n=1 Tax=Streptomyces sp. NPDC048551 TaxID=3155758 RepID=UPI003444272A